MIITFEVHDDHDDKDDDFFYTLTRNNGDFYLRNQIEMRWHAVMPLPLIAASDSFPILPLAIIFVNQRQGQYGTALFSGYHILPQPETMKNR